MEIGKQLVLEGIRAGSGIIRDPKCMMGALCNRWAPTFQKKPVDHNGADDFLKKYASKLDVEC